MEEKSENVKVSLCWSVTGLQKLLCCLSLSLKAENETPSAKAVFHLQGVLRRWRRFCETDRGFTNASFRGGLERCGVSLLPFSLAQSLAMGKGKVLPINPSKKYFKEPLTQLDLVSGTPHPQA